MTTKVMHENDNYKVVVTEHPENGEQTYGLINKASGVFEEYSSILPEIKVHAEQFDAMEKQEYHKQFGYIEEAEAVNGENVTPFQRH